jgi:hypothetical protein
MNQYPKCYQLNEEAYLSNGTSGNLAKLRPHRRGLCDMKNCLFCQEIYIFCHFSVSTAVLNPEFPSELWTSRLGFRSGFNLSTLRP